MPPKKTVKASGGAGATPLAPSIETLYFQHYDAYVAKYGPRTAILLQVGKFYEVYDSIDMRTGVSRANAIAVVEACEVAIDPKPTEDPLRSRVFWGFPEASLAKFERMLVAKGYTVVVIAQKKDGTGDVIERVVDHISSPGTFWDIEGGLAVRKDEQILLGIYIEPYMDSEKSLPHWYVASTAFDSMTGKAVSTETDLTVLDGKPVYDPIEPFWSVYPPAEVVVWWSSATLVPPTQKQFQALFAGYTPLVHIVQLDPKKEMSVLEDRKRLTFLTEIYHPDTAIGIAEYLGIERHPFVRRSLALLLAFIQDHNPSYLRNLHAHTLWCPDEYCLLGNAALEQLAMLPPNAARPQESLLHWLQKTTTSMGGRALRERCLKPLTDCDELEARQERIATLRATSAARVAIEAQLKGVFDLPRIYRRIQLGSATTDDLLQLVVTYKKAAALLAATEGAVYGLQDSAAAALVAEHLTAVVSMWDEDRIRAAKQVGGGGGGDAGIALGSCHVWRRGVHPELDAQEDAWAALETTALGIKTQWETLLEDSGAIEWTLREDVPFTFTTTARRATSIAALAKSRLRQDVTHTKRGASTTVVLDSPELGHANTEGAALRAAWRAAVVSAWRADWRVWTEAAIATGVLEILVDFLATLDVECTLARIADEYGYVRPTYVESTQAAVAGVHIQDLRHPILERVTTSPYVPHTLSYGAFSDDKTGGLLVYGVNAAGKSSLGKALGLAIVLAQCGIPVPAKAMRLIPYTGLFTRILGNDNLWAGMSSFVVEMTEFRSILRAAGPRTLVIGDELCAGTETASATSIVAAGVQTLRARGAHFFFATHLHELAEIPEVSNNAGVRMVHLSVHATAAGVLVYDRVLRDGCGSPMYGLEVCRGLDMDAEFLRLAFDYRKRLFGGAVAAGPSRYNAAVLMTACGVCGSRNGLETHHIVPQAAANAAGRIAPGVHKNTGANLVVLCDTCHKAHHGGMLEIQGWADTTAGRKLRYTVGAGAGAPAGPTGPTTP
jgi:DNA mismatch repair protein MutS